MDKQSLVLLLRQGLSIERIAKRFGTEFILEGRGYYRCRRCRAEAVVRHREKLKAVLVDEAGGKCCICGYDRFLRALEFHHLDPSQKRLGLSGKA